MVQRYGRPMNNIGYNMFPIWAMPINLAAPNSYFGSIRNSTYQHMMQSQIPNINNSAYIEQACQNQFKYIEPTDSPGTDGTGPARPVDIKFDPSGREMHIVDFGVLTGNASTV